MQSKKRFKVLNNVCWDTLEDILNYETEYNVLSINQNAKKYHESSVRVVLERKTDDTI